MKYLIWLLMLVAVWFWLRWSRKPLGKGGAQRNQAPEQDQPQAMIQCPVCGFHLPRNEAFIGRSGAYCSEDHRARQEG
jgi:uncharacterized protein